ncbi:MAG: SIS domain-containing protein [Rhodospirillales bacterium]
MNLDDFFTAEFDELADVSAATREAARAPFERLLRACADSVRAGGKIMLFGNGGSASDAQHLSTELAVRFKTDRAPIAALALNTDTSAITAIANDFDFSLLFARQIEALGKPGDVALGISTSGNSVNVIKGLEQAKAMSIIPAALTGKGGGKLNGLADPMIVVPSNTTARIQEMHIMLGQMLCGALEIELGLV